MLVRGGPANSGTKRPLREQPKTGWFCHCPKFQKRYMASCSKCRDRRP